VPGVLSLHRDLYRLFFGERFYDLLLLVTLGAVEDDIQIPPAAFFEVAPHGFLDHLRRAGAYRSEQRPAYLRLGTFHDSSYFLKPSAAPQRVAGMSPSVLPRPTLQPRPANGAL
jgi:hypothetical protein